MKRNVFLSFAIVVAAALPAAAQQPVPGAHFIENWDMDADGRVTAEEARQKRGEIFAMFDQNEDGALDAAEYDLFDETRESDIKENIGEKTGPMAVFSQAMARDFNDMDKDGLVTRDEFLAQASAWFELMDRDKDDLITPGDFGPRKS